MAEFIIANSLRQMARRHPLLHKLLLRLDFAFVWMTVKLARLLPIDASSRYGERVGRWVGPKLKEKSVKFHSNYAVAFPELDSTAIDELVVRAWGSGGRVLAEYTHLDAILNDPQRLEIDIREPIPTYSNPTRPCVIVTAHLGNWEVVALALTSMGIPSACLYSPPTNPLLDRMLQESRQALDCDMLPRDNAARSLLRAMKKGRTAAMVMDRRVDGGQPIEFFGRAKPSTILPARLALKMNCELIPVQLERQRDARYRVIFHPPVKPRDTGAGETAQAIDMIQQVHNQFETWIRQRPQEWFCSKLIWPKASNQNQLEGSEHETVVESRPAR